MYGIYGSELVFGVDWVLVGLIVGLSQLANFIFLSIFFRPALEAGFQYVTNRIKLMAAKRKEEGGGFDMGTMGGLAQAFGFEDMLGDLGPLMNVFGGFAGGNGNAPPMPPPSTPGRGFLPGLRR